jgi:cellulose synthase (UDP-forming)
MSFESPVSSGRTVVALLGSDGRAVESLTAVLGDDGKTQLIRGDLTIVRGGDLQSYQGGETYYVGSLSWWQWLWFHLSHHALWVTLLSLGAAIAAALLTYGRLQRLAARRLGTRAAD